MEMKVTFQSKLMNLATRIRVACRALFLGNVYIEFDVNSDDVMNQILAAVSQKDEGKAGK